MIANEYGQFFSDLNSEMLAKLRVSSKIIEVDENFNRYFENQKEAIKSDSSLSEPEKELSEIKPCLAHGDAPIPKKTILNVLKKFKK